jgi:hypothetical protein
MRVKRSPVSVRKLIRCLITAFLFITAPANVFSQQPFITDDADVTSRHRFHFEFSNEIDWLQRSSFPSRKQNTLDFEVNYGLFHGVEVGVQVPVITIFNDRSSQFLRPTGIGDMNISMKYNFREERKESRWPAMSVNVNFEVPTGDVGRQLGSGLADLYINGIIQKTLPAKTMLRLNGGLLSSGNDTTGAIGIKSRGRVATGGCSLVHEFTPKLDLGVELVGAFTKNSNLGKGSLQSMVGGNYLLRDNMTFDFGIVFGKFVGSPRAGVQLGISIDF